MKRKNITKAVKKQGSIYRDTWQAIEDALFAEYGCLLPSCYVVPFVKHHFLPLPEGILKRP